MSLLDFLKPTKKSAADTLDIAPILPEQIYESSVLELRDGLPSSPRD